MERSVVEQLMFVTMDLMFKHAMALLDSGIDSPLPIAHLFQLNGEQEIVGLVDIKDNAQEAADILKIKLATNMYAGMLLRLDTKTSRGDAILVNYQTPIVSEIYVINYNYRGPGHVTFSRPFRQEAPSSGPISEMFHLFPLHNC